MLIGWQADEEIGQSFLLPILILEFIILHKRRAFAVDLEAIFILQHLSLEIVLRIGLLPQLRPGLFVLGGGGDLDDSDQ